MKRARIVIVLVVLVLGCLSFALFHSREPRYEGRKLSDWLGTQVIGDMRRGPEQWQETNRAVERIGTNAIPFLLKWVLLKDTPAKQKTIAWLDQHPSFHIRIEPAYYYHAMAHLGFRLLGNDAKAARPALIGWTSDADPERRFWALRCLVATKPDRETIIPVLRRAIYDPTEPIQMEVASAIGQLHLEDVEIRTNQANGK